VALQPGEVSDPIASASGVYIVQLVDREAGQRPPLAEIEPQVRAEMKRRAGDDAVRAALERLRREGEVVTAEELP
jgi:parvulin-like peptidyl-prolyl isomerase